jgi:hypothetical protein
MKALGKGSIASIVQIGLSVAWWLLWIMFAAWAVAALAYAVFMGMVAAGAIDPASLPPIERSDGAGGNSIEVSISGFDADGLSPQWTDWQIIAPALIAAGVGVGGSLIIVWRLRRLFDSFTSGEPFRRENAQHLRVIWITMVAVELSRYALLTLIGLLLSFVGKPESVESVSFSIDSDNLGSWMSILVLIVLAEVFREGARLKEEQELTI